MKTMEQSWGRFLPRALVLGAILAVSVFVAVRAAVAREGEPGGHTRTALTVAGSLTVPMGATPSLTFRFYRGAAVATAPLVCGPIVVSGTDVRYVEATHTFSAQVPIDSTPACEAMFNGESVWVTTAVTNGPDGGVLLEETARSAVNPVPYARYADQYGSPDCPVGYERNPTTPSGRTYCRKVLSDGAYDEVVRVGNGASAFWLDRYEATAWHHSDGSGARTTPYGTSGDDYLVPDNGQWTTTAIYALSRTGYQPSRYITWFQAQEACRANGKRLPTGEEWLTAARGTSEVGCHLSGGDTARAPRTIVLSPCESLWGAVDMTGNVAEWTAEWFGGPGDTASNASSTSWPRAQFPGEDQTFNVGGSVFEAGSVRNAGLPAAAVRGGSWRRASEETGIFVFDLRNAPSVASEEIGFRCVIPR